jgi:hypothetical protein
MTRLGSKLPFQEAIEEVWHSHQTAVGEATCRRATYRHGQAAETLVNREVERLEKEGLDERPGPEKMLLSADGSFIRLTSGEWREVKGLAVGEFETVHEGAEAVGQVKTKKLSYFTRSYPVRDFETYALAELARRGFDQAATVVAVNDGAQWLQSFIDYHCPKAVRILDFAHALGHVAEAGKAVLGESNPDFKPWFERCAHQLKHEPPQRTLAELSLLQPKAKREDQAQVLHGTQAYLQHRLKMIDYPYFQRRGYPIGSGSVESAHKQVVQRRLKGPGMRWAAHHVDPLLALRDLLSNGRWNEGWRDIVALQLQQQRAQRQQRAQAKQPSRTPPIAPSSSKTPSLLPKVNALDNALDQTPSAPRKKKRDPKDHPWRRGLWPTKESWRWNK